MGKHPGEGNGNPVQYPCLENSKGQRNVAGYSPWGGKESAMTEHISTNGEAMETVTGFISVGSKITVDGDCIHEIKWLLLLGRKAMTNVDCVLKAETSRCWQYFGHLMQRAISLEKTPMLGKFEGKRRGWHRMRWLNSITESMNMNLSELWG